MKPNLFIVGAPKCGTTAWVHYLNSHPDIFFSPVKEPHHFCLDFPNYRAVRERDEYLDLFKESGSASVLGEASVWYLYSQVAAEQIRKFNPEAKILIFVRDQQDFVPSLHNQTLYTGDETITDFETAWRLSGKRDSSNSSRFCREEKFLDYKDAGMFSRHVERFFAQFPEEQIRVFHFRDWSRNPRATYLEILRFLGLKDDGRTDFAPVNKAKRNRIRWLAPLIRFRPAPVASVVKAIKRLTGRQDLGMSAWMSRMNRRPGYATRIPDALREEIQQYYRRDNELLERRISSPGADDH